jgi:hypothetical protein
LIRRAARVQSRQIIGETGTCPTVCFQVLLLTFGRDSYHYYGYHLDELTSPFQNKLWSASRGLKRYDPHTRRYRQWHLPHDWHDQRLGPQGEPNYPRFTWDESVRMLRRLRRGHSVDATRMGKEWHHEGPRVSNKSRETCNYSKWLMGPQRFNYEYDWFWQEAHRVGENMRQGFRRQSAVNPNLRMHQNYPNDLDDWVYREFI